MNNNLQDCVNYFKKNRGYIRIFQMMKEKWKSYGKVCGNIIINNPTVEEQEAIKKLMGIVVDNKKLKFKMTDFERAIKESKFRQVELLELLEGYFQEKISYYKEKELDKEIAKKEFFKNIENKLKSENLYDEDIEKIFNRLIFEKSSLYKYGVNNTETEKMIFLSLKAIKFLKTLDSKIKISILGARIAKSPHYFDRGSTAGNFFIYLLCLNLNIEYTKATEKILDIYYQSNIEVDNISSYTAGFGIKLYTKLGEHKAYQEFIKNSEDYIITMSNLKNIVRADSENKKVFVIENQMIYSYLCEYFKNKNISILCTAGQLKTASLILIDMLCKEECKLYYSGDFDPEGIEIADKLIQRNKNIIPWNFTVENYQQSLSKNLISEERLKKLDKIKTEHFYDLIKLMKKEKKSGYQELILKKLIKDMEESIK